MALLAAGLAVVLVLAAIGGAQLANRQVETVSALSPGDYVELEGVVSATPGADGSVSVASGIGSLAVELTGETSLREGAMTVGREALRPGRGVVISGTVDNEGRIAAHAIAVREEGSRPLPGGGPLRPLPGREEEGTIVAVSVASEGGQARVTIQTEGGESFVAIIDGDAAEELLRLGSAIGTRVSLTPRADGGPPHVEVRQSAPPGTGIARFRGVVVSREGPVFVLEARDGPVEVVIGPHTRVLAGGLAIAVERILSGEEALEGRMLTVGGGVENGTGRILANVIIIGREMP